VGLWGSNAGAVLALAGGSDKLSVLAGALRYAIRHEGATCLSDFFVRRSALLYFGRRWIEASLPTARQVIAAELGEGHDPDPGMVFAGEYARAVDFA
jgi:glycerol-3-phosphate dehydrogenase